MIYTEMAWAYLWGWIMTEIKRKGHLQKQTLRLTVTSPVSIGTGASYSPCEYYYDAKSGKVYFLHLGEWFKLMDKKGKSIMEP